jgi:HSP20 family protein
MIEKSSAVPSPKISAAVKVVSAETFAEQMNKIFQSIARRAFEIFESTDRSPGHEAEHWFKAESELFRHVPAKVTETPEAFNIRADLPGFEAQQLQVSVEPRKLTITGKREIRNEKKVGNTVYAEQRSDELFRVFDLTAEINPGATVATLKGGILNLTLPKKGVQKRLRVEPKAAA